MVKDIARPLEYPMRVYDPLGEQERRQMEAEIKQKNEEAARKNEEGEAGRSALLCAEKT